MLENIIYQANFDEQAIKLYAYLFLHFSNISDEVLSLREFSTNMVIEATSKCLHMINEDINLPTSLPGSMSARFRIGASLAAACQVCFSFQFGSFGIDLFNFCP